MATPSVNQICFGLQLSKLPLLKSECTSALYTEPKQHVPAFAVKGRMPHGTREQTKCGWTTPFYETKGGRVIRIVVGMLVVTHGNVTWYKQFSWSYLFITCNSSKWGWEADNTQITYTYKRWVSLGHFTVTGLNGVPALLYRNIR